MRTLLYLFIFCTLLSTGLGAQPNYYNVKHAAGTQTIAGTAVTALPISAPTTTTSVSCSVIQTPVYWIGNSSNPNAYSFAFNAPAKSVRLRFANLNQNETIRIFINGAKYNLTPSNLFAITSCPSGSPTISGGDLLVAAAPAPPGGIYAELQIATGSPIDSIRIFHVNAVQGGCVFDLAFEPALYPITPAQTQFCAGDQTQIFYIALPGYFTTSNSFTIQLSDASGNFSSPVAIGSLVGNVTGFVNCKIPDNTPSGTGYRVRAVSSDPAMTSIDNGFNLRVDRFAVLPKPTSNSPICADDSLILTAQNVTPNVSITWQTDGYTSDGIQVIRYGMEKNNQGKYWIVAKYFSCIYTDTINVVVKYKPIIGTPVALPTTLCEDDTIMLAVRPDLDTPGVTYEWNGPADFYAQGDTVFRYFAHASHSGAYHIVASYNGCAAGAATDVNVKPKPDSVWAAANMTTLVSGQELRLQAGSLSFVGTVYNWTGPNGYKKLNDPAPRFKVGLKDEGIYLVTADLDGCTRSAFVVIFVHQSPRDVFDLSPNPATDKVHLHGYLQIDQDPIEVKIFNASGDFITRKLIASKDKEVDADIALPPYLSPGTYVLRIYVDQLQRDYRFLIMK